MAARFFSSRSKAIALTLTRGLNPTSSLVDASACPHQGLPALRSVTSSPPLSNEQRYGGYSSTGASRFPTFAHSKICAYTPHQAPYILTRPLHLGPFSDGKGRGVKQEADNSHKDFPQSTAVQKNVEPRGARENLDASVVSFSPLEGTIVGKRATSALAKESLKIKRMELSQKITFALIPALLLFSKNSFSTSLLVFSVYWQIYGFFKEIFLDYIHHEVTREWVLVYFRLLLLILAKDTLLLFNLV
ncbi:hypothetical protein HPP92_004566 [Vanilla planifolia]|uniref:Succinate dehydrogenase subunit 4, mitochondrial n=1 Tax=Vanilla planifolia TaxID=51239 RepID=A0A835RWZ3_VANPL|nr:hypothetical protein HPP92_004566 [Vanilla planifolia]